MIAGTGNCENFNHADICLKDSKLVLKESLLRAQEESIPMQSKSSKCGIRPPWFNTDLLTELKHEKETYRRGDRVLKWNVEISRPYKNGVRKAKAQLKLKVLSNVKGKKEGSCKYSGSKWKHKKNVGLLLTVAEELVTRDMENTRVLNVSSASVSTEECHWKAALYQLQKVMATLAPDDWKKANITSVFRKGKNENPVDYSPVSLSLVPRKIMDQFLLEDMSPHEEKR